MGATSVTAAILPGSRQMAARCSSRSDVAKSNSGVRPLGRGGATSASGAVGAEFMACPCGVQARCPDDALLVPAPPPAAQARGGAVPHLGPGRGLREASRGTPQKTPAMQRMPDPKAIAEGATWTDVTIAGRTVSEGPQIRRRISQMLSERWLSENYFS